MQWINERSDDSSDGEDSRFKTRRDFLRSLAQADRETLDAIDVLAATLTTDDETPTIDMLVALAAPSARPAFDTNMVVTMACAVALAHCPDLTTWQTVRSIANHSWEIEHWLHEAMAAQAARDVNAKERYVALLTQLFQALESGACKSASPRRNESREGARAHWEHAEHKLDEIWWGLRGADFMNFEEEVRVLGLLAELAPAEFQALIARSRDPFLVDAALLGAGVGAFSPRFAQWETCVEAAPPAFAPDGRWTGLVLLPLLLVHGQRQLVAASSQFPRFDANVSEVPALTAQVVELAEAVVDVIARRTDALAALARWSTWLMRQVLVSKDDEFDDIRARGFVNKTLLGAIDKAMHGKEAISRAPDDAAPWEAWCYRCVQSYFAQDRHAPLPDVEAFASQWRLSPEDWHEQKGRQLLAMAELHIMRADVPSLSSRLLAVPFAARDTFAEDWRALWDEAFYLREVVEFGSAAAESRVGSDKSDASRLLLLLASMALACLDQVADRLGASSDPVFDGIERLHGALAAAVMDLLHIDDTIYREQWLVLLHHVALRRAYWDRRYGSKPGFALFSEASSPAVPDYLVRLQANPGDLVAFLYSCERNDLNLAALREDLLSAGIDLRAHVATLKRLNGLRDRAYPLNSAAIRALAPLMDAD